MIASDKLCHYVTENDMLVCSTVCLVFLTYLWQFNDLRQDTKQTKMLQCKVQTVCDSCGHLY